METKPVIALMYDFDKTLSTKDMQEYTFIPRVHMSPQEFWREADQLAKANRMDKILAYMYLMLRKADEARVSIRRDNFIECGKAIEFFPGVDTWFERMDTFGETIGVTIEHYIISSGLKEIIEGSPIGKYFKEIYGCEFYYNHNGLACWPATVVNYTSKTQYLFRINKGVLDVSDDDSVNELIPEDLRSVPFRNMLYFGDGLTDIPCMKLVKVNGGQSFAVYGAEGTQSEGNARKLLLDGRVNYCEKADYSEGSSLELLVKEVIQHMARKDQLVRRTLAQKQRSEEVLQGDSL